MITFAGNPNTRRSRSFPGTAGTHGLQIYYPFAQTGGTAIINEELCTVGFDYALITWVTLKQPADTTIGFGEEPEQLVRHTICTHTEFHWVEIYGLKPATRYWYQVESNGIKGALNSFATLPKPKGKHLFNFALFSDTHIAYPRPAKDINEIYFGKLVEHAGTLFYQCILDSKRRNIDLAVITGDLTDTAHKQQYSALRRQLLPGFGPVPYLLCIGNHDKYTKDDGLGEKGFLEYVANREKTCTSVMFRDYQFILVDSCKQNNNWGHLDAAQLQWISHALQEAGKPAFLFLHHPCNGPDTWFGVKNYQALQKTIRPFSWVQGVFSGHLHRNKVTTSRMLTGSLPYVEVPATVQFPCAYAVVQVYEDGFVYNTYKVSRLDLSEMSRGKFILKHGGNALLTWYGFGGIGDRCFAYLDGRLHRPARYELSIALPQPEALALYQKMQSGRGASLAAAHHINKYKVILGQYASPHLAVQSYRQQFLPFSGKMTLSQEGNCDVPQNIKQCIK